jgi:VIT1/CCC1 family predicted Fe2+/Mn2+ transporter
LLDPIDRSSEILFALIMALGITGSISVAHAGREDVHTMLVGALGCNLAWGIVDAVMYLMAGLTERARALQTMRTLRRAPDPAVARRVIADALPEPVAAVLELAEFEAIRVRLSERPEPPAHSRLGRDDWLGALAVFLWVFLATFPVVLPFVFMHSALHALRVSNGIAVTMLYLTGHLLGRYAGGRPWVTGLAMVLVGIALVATTMALGG